ncbi:ATP-binding protein [Candidatus Pyrohabitans sp.]
MYDRELVFEFYEKLENKRAEIKERDLKIKPRKDFTISIVGPRRAGKTFLLLDVYFRDIERAVYFDFEHVAFADITHKEVFEIISLVNPQANLVMLDEVQVVEDWNKLVRSLLDSGYKVIISGSSSKLMSKEIATQLRGRSISYILLPLSFGEFLRFKNLSYEKISVTKKTEIIKLLEEYLLWGGYPGAITRKDKDEILKNYYTTILYNDFVERFELKSIDVAKFIFEFCFQNFSKEVSIRKISSFVNSKIGGNVKNVVYSYVDRIPETMCVFFVDRYHKSVYSRKSWPRKLYVCDLGLSTVMGFSEDTGKRMENAIFLEILRKTNQHPLTEIYYFKDAQGHEVDFVVKDGLKVRELIQVTYASSFDEIDHREIRALLKAKELLKCKELKIITWDYEDEREVKWFGRKGRITFIPMWKWLLKLG